IYNGAPDLQIAVTTSTTGTLRVSPAVPSGVIKHALSFEDGELKTNYQGTIASALSSLMDVGADSTLPNAVVASTQLALETNFVRPSSGLGILVISAADDESIGDIANYADAIHARPNDVMLSAVVA